MALSAPRLFRWEYVRPHEQLIVADGKKVWMYEPDLEQATVREQGKEEQNSPLTALINPALLEQQYDVSEEAAQRDGLQWLSLSPKRETEASFQYAALGFNAQGLAKMEITDAVGQRTVISFSGWKRNPGFAAGTFSFTRRRAPTSSVIDQGAGHGPALPALMGPTVGWRWDMPASGRHYRTR